ncbi:MAG: polyhydroxyalkanoic acid system family protein [Burkholderiales bacterium]|nr:polyhydroxyalkanoic acid system family protein [Burkholderiales bacterium]
MPDIRIHRAHRLGLARARQVAWSWAEQVERDFDLACTVREGEAGDTVEFQRTGVSGRLLVAADHFDLEARLGFLLGAFSRTIEAEITKNLDALLAAATAPAPAAAAAAAPSTRKTAAGGAKARAQASAAAQPKPRKTPPARR